MQVSEDDELNLAVAERLCLSKGWRLLDTAGRGGTAPVFTVQSGVENFALKLYDREFSTGPRGDESLKRIALQVEKLGLHGCPHIVRVHQGDRFEDRLYVLMDKAPGSELEKRLKEVPRNKIRSILHQIAAGAMFLRELGLCHRDIKSANVFVTDDFEKATLLDLSVLRDVDDPIGLGTDHGNQLPVVATSRYSPPEYLFRLVDAGRELWHALDVYQLGGILHDLIMREPMFESEYQINKDSNRYRFAWVVATQDPIVSAHDVDQDLVILARRALDKDWQRRSALRLEDFLNDAQTRRDRGLQALGATVRDRAAQVITNLSELELEETCRAVKESIRESLASIGIRAIHSMNSAADPASRVILFQWDSGDGADMRDVRLTVQIGAHRGIDAVYYTQRATLAGQVEGEERETSIDYPNCRTDSDAALKLSEAVNTSLGDMAASLLQVKPDEV